MSALVGSNMIGRLLQILPGRGVVARGSPAVSRTAMKKFSLSTRSVPYYFDWLYIGGVAAIVSTIYYKVQTICAAVMYT